jgi:Ni,Fe-hydrogenase I cytochrome b subunit
MSHGPLKEYYVYSPWLRIFHWLMVGSVVILFATGLYIGNPFFGASGSVEPTFAVNAWLSMETIRFIHFAAAYILVAAFILRLYGFAVNKGDRLLPKFWTKLYWQGLADMTLHYMFLHPITGPTCATPWPAVRTWAYTPCSSSRRSPVSPCTSWSTPTGWAPKYSARSTPCWAANTTSISFTTTSPG